jgi:hypothetical protein
MIKDSGDKHHTSGARPARFALHLYYICTIHEQEHAPSLAPSHRSPRGPLVSRDSQQSRRSGMPLLGRIPRHCPAIAQDRP